MAKKVQVTFSDRQLDLIQKFRGELGESDSEVVRGIVISWLAEKSFISTVVKNRLSSEQATQFMTKDVDDV
jgi:hypothetical protein